VAENITMAEIAKRVGVTQSAVSVVLSGRKSTIGVSRENRERILETAKNLNFKPNIFGRSLVNRRSFSLALLCRESCSSHIPDIIRGVQDVVHERDYALLTFCHGDSAEDERIHLRRSLDRRADGIIVMAALDPDGRTNIEEFRAVQKQGIPVVQLLEKTLLGIPSVMAERYESGRLACRHLIELGHRRIVHLAHAGIYDTRIAGYYEDAVERANGYRDEMISHGLEPVIITHPVTNDLSDCVRFAEQVTPEIVNHPSRPTAVMVYNCYQAFGVMRALKQMKKLVPGDMSIVGFSVLEMDSTILTDPPLTTIVEPTIRIGQEAGRMVFDLMEGKPVKDVALEQKLIVRGSTGHPKD
jgi:DNA-binding LacI/PurR family transcriptional regulator